MEVLQSIQADCELLGIDSYNLRPNHQLNLRSSIAFALYILSTISSSYYFFYVDKSFEQYITSYYATTSIFVCFIQFANLFWQMPNSTHFFSSLEKFVQQRKYNCQNFLFSSINRIEALKLQSKILFELDEIQDKAAAKQKKFTTKLSIGLFLVVESLISFL